MAEKIRGVITELVEYTKDGKRMGSSVEFHPYCDYYWDKAGDYYACTTYKDFANVVNEFG